MTLALVVLVLVITAIVGLAVEIFLVHYLDTVLSMLPR